MNRTFFVVPALALCVAASAFSQGLPGKLGVINIQAAIVGTKDGQKAAADLETKLGPKRKELEKKQADIKSLQDQLSRGGNAMAAAAKQELMTTIDVKTKSFNRDMEDASAEYDQEQQRVLGELVEKLRVVIDKYAKDNGFALILDVSNPNSPIAWASTAIDVTKDIVELYDKNAPIAAPAAPKPPATKK